MLTQMRLVTLEEFFDFIQRPENVDRDYELVGGRVIEVVSDQYASRVTARIIRYLDTFVDDNNLGRVTGADGGYMIVGNPYIPDVAFISFEKQPKLKQKNGYNILAPELAVEVLSPGNTAQEMSTKTTNYLSAGTVVWIVDPQTKTVNVHISGQAVKQYTLDDTLDGGSVLKGFSVAVKKLFPERE